MLELFTLSVIRKAFVASVLVGLLLPLVGNFALMTRTAFLGAGIAHIAFAGVAFGIMLSFSPLLGAFLFALLSVAFIWYAEKRNWITYDVGMSILFSFFMALAILFLGLTKQYSGEAMSYLFGSVLTVSTVDIILLFITVLLFSIFVGVFYKELFHIILSRDLALASGLPVDTFTFLMLLFMTISIVVSMKAVGALLVFGLLVMPSAAAYRLTFRFHIMILLSLLFGLISSIAGFFISLTLDIPSGAAIVIIAFLLLIMSFIFSRK